MTTRQSLDEAYDPLDAHRQDPYPFYAQVRQRAPVFFAPELGVWVVSRYEDVRSVLRRTEEFSSVNSFRASVRPGPAAMAVLRTGYPPAHAAVTADGEEHRRLRAPFAEAMTPERVDALRPAIQAHADALVDAVVDAGSGELVGDVVRPLALRTIVCRVFGLNEEDIPVIGDGADEAIRLFHLPLEEAEQAAAAGSYVAYQRLVAERLRERRAAPRDDLLSQVLAALAPGDGPLTFEQETLLVFNVVEVLLAGHVTTVPLLANSVRALLADRDQWVRLCADPALVGGAVEELCRYATSVHGLYRKATREVTVGEVRLPAGAEVMLWFASANRDEAVFDGAGTLDLARDARHHLTFGFGVHHCAGAWLARAQLQVVVSTLARRLPGLRLAEPVTVRPNVGLYGPEALHVTW
jgi:cytochrome P450